MTKLRHSYYDWNGNPITLLEWAALFEKRERKVANDFINGYRISTIWMGIDHNFGEGAPLIFETMIFPNSSEIEKLNHYQERYSTLEEAEKGHKKACNLVKRLTK